MLYTTNTQPLRLGDYQWHSLYLWIYVATYLPIYTHKKHFVCVDMCVCVCVCVHVHVCACACVTSKNQVYFHVILI